MLVVTYLWLQLIIMTEKGFIARNVLCIMLNGKTNHPIIYSYYGSVHDIDLQNCTIITGNGTSPI